MANKRMSATITVRFDPDEAQRIYRFAAAFGLTLSDVIRAAVRLLPMPTPPPPAGWAGWTPHFEPETTTRASVRVQRMEPEPESRRPEGV